MSVLSAGENSLMEYDDGEGSNSKPAISSGGGSSASHTDGSSSGFAVRGCRLSQPFSASAYLVPAFNACATGLSSYGSDPTDMDATLLRYTRPHLFCNSSSSDEMPLLRQLLHLRASLGSSSSDSPLSPSSPAWMARTPQARSPSVFCTPAKGAVLEDGVLVINDDPQADSRAYHSAARRILALGSPSSANSTTNIVRGGGGYLRKVQGPRSFEDAGYAVEYQMMAWLANASQIKPRRRHRRLSSSSPAGGPANAQRFSHRMLTTDGDDVGTPAPQPSPGALEWPQMEEQEAELERALIHGPRRWRRLPVFATICPEEGD